MVEENQNKRFRGRLKRVETAEAGGYTCHVTQGFLFWTDAPVRACFEPRLIPPARRSQDFDDRKRCNWAKCLQDGL